MEKNKLNILSCLRKNARRNLTSISKATGIPISTLFEKLKKYEGGIIRKHTSLLDFNKLGFSVRVYMAIKVNKKDRENLKVFLERNPIINNLYRVTNGSDFIIEGIFRNLGEFEDFSDDLETFKIQSKQQYYVLEDIKRESFLENEATIPLSPQ